MVYKKYLLIAHYHKDGQIRSDLVNLIKLFSKSFEKIIFVSTKLSFSEKKRLKDLLILSLDQITVMTFIPGKLELILFEINFMMILIKEKYYFYYHQAYYT